MNNTINLILISVALSSVFSLLFVLILWIYHNKKIRELQDSFDDRLDEIEQQLGIQNSAFSKLKDTISSTKQDDKKNTPPKYSKKQLKEIGRAQAREEARQNQKIQQEKDKELKQQSKANAKKEDSQQENRQPKDAEFTYYSVSDGCLVKTSIGQTSYYRSWVYKGQILYEFYCEQSKLAKAINNRSSLIEPFCIKVESSVEAITASKINTVEYGVLSEDLSISTPTKIKFQ